MKKKRFFILLLPTLIIGIFLLVSLPSEYGMTALLAPVALWIMYYSGIYSK